MTTLLASLQKLCILNLNLFFTPPSTASATNNSSKLIVGGNRNTNSVDKKSAEEEVAAEINENQELTKKSFGGTDCELRKRFYWTNLVLDTNHHCSCDQIRPRTASTSSIRRTTRSTTAVLKKQQAQQMENGSIIAAAPSTIKSLISDSVVKTGTATTKPGTGLTGGEMGAIKFLTNEPQKNKKNRATNNNEKSESNNIGNESESKSSFCRCFDLNKKKSGTNSLNDADCGVCCGQGSNGDLIVKKRVYCYHEAPHYLKFNPHITGGYRGMLRPFECLKSLFWWTNETLNIWTHLTGWFLFLGLSVYDFLELVNLQNIQPMDQFILTILLLCFQACMLLSSLYHIFCCHSEVSYRRWLSADLLGVSLSLLAIYVSGIYYAFSCVPFWLNFYLVTVGAIFSTAIFMQILPIISKKEMVTEEKFRWRLVVFGGWAAYGVVPTLHWAYLHGMSGPAVSMLLPRIFGVYIISMAAFFFYVTRFPEKLWPGLVNYVGSSHQIWHILIVAALYHWHNTGMMYLEFRAEHPCSEEYEYLFGSSQESPSSLVLE